MAKLMIEYMSIVAGLTVVFGAAMVFGAYRMNRRQHEVLLNSTNVLGTVTKVDIDQRRRADTNKSPRFYPVLEYEYEYLGETYTGSNLYPSTSRARFSYNEKSNAEEIIEDFTKGEELSVHVSTADPTHSFVFREKTPKRIYALGLTGLGTILFGIWMLQVA